MPPTYWSHSEELDCKSIWLILCDLFLHPCSRAPHHNGNFSCWLCIALRHWNWRLQRKSFIEKDRVQFLEILLDSMNSRLPSHGFSLFLYITFIGNAVIVSTILLINTHTPMHSSHILASSKTHWAHWVTIQWHSDLSQPRTQSPAGCTSKYSFHLAK